MCASMYTRIHNPHAAPSNQPPFLRGFLVSLRKVTKKSSSALLESVSLLRAGGFWELVKTGARLKAAKVEKHRSEPEEVLNQDSRNTPSLSKGFPASNPPSLPRKPICTQNRMISAISHVEMVLSQTNLRSCSRRHQ